MTLETVRHIENDWITLSDGCRLAVRLWLPADAGAAPVPAILEYIPYRKRDFMRRRDERMHRWFAAPASPTASCTMSTWPRSRTMPWKSLPGLRGSPGAPAMWE